MHCLRSMERVIAGYVEAELAEHIGILDLFRAATRFPCKQAVQALPTYANFMVAGASGMSAWMFIHPIDVVKTRMQLLSNSRGNFTAFSVCKDIVSF